MTCHAACASSTMPLASGAGGAASAPSRSALRLAAIRQAGVKLDEIAQRQADAAEPDGQPGRLALRQRRRHAGLPEARHEPRRPDRVEQAHRRHVERQLQRLADADIALIAHVEILRPVAGEIGGPVLDQRLLRDQPFLERQPVDERLQRRARRAQRPRHVDPAGAAGVEDIRRADLAEDFAGHGVGQHHGHRHAGAELVRGVARHRLEPFLHALAERQPMAGSRQARLRSAVSAAWAASAGRARRLADTSSSAARAASVSPSRPAVPCGQARGRARLAQLRDCGPDGGARAIAAGRRAAPPPKRSAASAPCRNKRARRRARPRDCRHRAPASGSARGFRAWTAAARSGWRGRSGGFSCRSCGFRAARSAARAASTASSRPRRCGRCRRTVLPRGRAPASRRRHAPRTACPHRRSASRRIAGRPGRGWRRAASARRSWRRP